jgi:hypothetical protein
MPSIIVLGQRRAVAELDATIERIDEQRRGQLAAVARLGATGEDATKLHALLRLTEDYLACLHQSRDILLWELPREERRRGAVPAATTVEAGAAGFRPRLVK